ncbi:TIGR02147 family protein [Bdellovibrio svalbardensis]|uniref:TIGR02147 family protein n=1 Tax=Bdellovibrio svalbardensis TaxID=2972972 RepID=A0ABT6DMP3_9BACT|nr:TIGR02147 family protein [Bdellovibrio svalbardensis]MDG0817884.1 TIGR02147 family protein [Bdellovibrio svalbardensis]
MAKENENPSQAIKDIFEKRVKRNPRYSLRAFARDLGTSAGRLSVIMAGKEQPGDRFNAKVLSGKALTAEEMKIFSNSLRSSKGLDEESVEQFLELSDYNSKELDTVEVHAILALLQTRKDNDDPQWIAKKLGYSLSTVKKSLQALVDHNIIVHRGKGYRQKISGIRYHNKHKDPQRVSAAYRDYLMQTVPTIMEQSREHTLFGTFVVSLDKKDIPKVRKLLANVFDRLHAMSEKGERTEVYNLSVVMQLMSKLE